MLYKLCFASSLLDFSHHLHPPKLCFYLLSLLSMSNTHESMVEEINAELAKSRLEADARMKALQERLEVAKHFEQEKVRKAEEARLKAKSKEEAKARRELEEAREKAEAERQAKEAQEKAKAEEKAKGARKVQEAREKTKPDNKAERVRLENRKRLYRELIKFKE
jgi:dTMP kinase